MPALPLYLFQVEELQISIEDEQRSIADELRAATEEPKVSIEESSGGASDAMAVDWLIGDPSTSESHTLHAQTF